MNVPVDLAFLIVKSLELPWKLPLCETSLLAHQHDAEQQQWENEPHFSWLREEAQSAWGNVQPSSGGGTAGAPSAAGIAMIKINFFFYLRQFSFQIQLLYIAFVCVDWDLLSRLYKISVH